MRIIGGRLKGKAINPPSGYKARPTTDFAKEALFNILDNEYEFDGLKVLDLFAGTGGISYEFASRGADRVYSVEIAPLHYNFIRSQAERLGLANLTAVRHNVFDFLGICRERFDIIFADPPYALEGVDTLPDRVLSKEIPSPDGTGATPILTDIGMFILEHSGEYDFSNHPCFVKERHYGSVHFSFFEIKR